MNASRDAAIVKSHSEPVSTATLPSALDHVDEITASGTRRLAVFLDYDGTLTPIVAHPEDAVLDDEMRDVVERLAQRCPVAVISGRDLADVRSRVALDDIVYAGSHGFDIAGPGGLRRTHPDARACVPALDAAEKAFQAPGLLPAGAQIERKAYSVAIHFRNVDDAHAAEVERAVNAVAEHHPELRKGHGKKVVELLPRVDWHKGRAVLWLLEALALDAAGMLPLYIGDDLTDEDAFEALRERGVGIVVRDQPRPTAARYALENPTEVAAFLTGLAAHAPTPGR
jgi:trehalose-phosphatase